MSKIDLELTNDILTDSNYWHRRFYRCWIDGSYNGQAHYQANCDMVRRNWDNPKRLRAMAITEWCQFLAAEFDCAPGTVQRHMVDRFTREELEALNEELVDDLRELVRWEMEESA